MQLIKDNFKNILIVLLMLLFLGACATIFYLLKGQKTDDLNKITGTVIVADSSYVIIEADKEDYLISNIKGSYQVGDEVEFSYFSSDLSIDENPKKIIIQDEELIKKIEIEKPSTNDKNDIDNNSNNQSNNEGANTTPNNNSNITSLNLPSNDNQQSTNNHPSTNTDTSADAQVLNYFYDLQSDFNASNIKESIKSSFITVIDFLFYNGKINGYTFSELTNSAKLKVLSMALYFDNKIDKYFPGYKESISNTANKVYTNVKEKIVTTYLNLTTSICTNNLELCDEAKIGFNELKRNFGLTWSLIKDIAGDGIANLKNWYEIWSGK